MAALNRLALPVLGAFVLASAAAAQDTYGAVSEVALFERVAVGEVEITPIGIIEESRCPNAELCFRGDDLVVSAILHTFTDGRAGMREIPLRLGRLTPVRGGALLLTNAGTEPVRKGAIPFDKYSLDIEFIPFP